MSAPLPAPLPPSATAPPAAPRPAPSRPPSAPGRAMRSARSPPVEQSAATVVADGADVAVGTVGTEVAAGVGPGAVVTDRATVVCAVRRATTDRDVDAA